MSDLPISIIERFEPSPDHMAAAYLAAKIRGQQGNECVTDASINELLKNIDKIALSYGSMAWGLPLHAPEIRGQL